MGEPEYFKDYKWIKDKHGNWDHQVETGKYNMFTTRKCRLIPIEIDRLEYLISYCLKNYYIKHANFVADGEYVPKWRYDNLADAARLDYESPQDCGHYERIRDLEEDLVNMTEARDYYKDKSDVFTQKQRGDGYKEGYEHKKQYIKDLENKLDTIKRISDYEELV